MTRELTPLEILRIAADMERNAAQFYRRAAGMYRDPSLSKLFSQLADPRLEEDSIHDHDPDKTEKPSSRSV